MKKRARRPIGRSMNERFAGLVCAACGKRAKGGRQLTVSEDGTFAIDERSGFLLLLDESVRTGRTLCRPCFNAGAADDVELSAETSLAVGTGATR